MRAFNALFQTLFLLNFLLKSGTVDESTRFVITA